MDPLTYRTIAVNDVELQVSVTNEGGHRSALLASHPAARADIERLAVPDDEPPSMPDGFAS